MGVDEVGVWVRNFSKLYILLELLDVLTTMVGILYFGAVEVTPSLSSMTIWNICLVKFIQVALVMAVLELPVNVPKLVRSAYWLPAVYFIYPFIHNTRVILKVILET